MLSTLSTSVYVHIQAWKLETALPSLDAVAHCHTALFLNYDFIFYLLRALPPGFSSSPAPARAERGHLCATGPAPVGGSHHCGGPC
jgi:hypothetical protein